MDLRVKVKIRIVLGLFRSGCSSRIRNRIVLGLFGLARSGCSKRIRSRIAQLLGWSLGPVRRRQFVRHRWMSEIYVTQAADSQVSCVQSAKLGQAYRCCRPAASPPIADRLLYRLECSCLWVDSQPLYPLIGGRNAKSDNVIWQVSYGGTIWEAFL